MRILERSMVGRGRRKWGKNEKKRVGRAAMMKRT
jgi:hypothetical protein